MNPFVEAIGVGWLSGPKYDFSKFLAGTDWNIDVETALNKYNLSLKDCKTLHDIDMYIRGKIFWLPDPIGQAWDVIYPPIQMLARGGDDCDGTCMFNAESIEHVLSPQGWKAYTASYLADPFTESHHFAIGLDPHGQVWAMQPPPSHEQWNSDPRWSPQNPNPYSCVYGPYSTCNEAVYAIAAQYKVKVVWYTIRGPKYEPLTQQPR